MPTRAQTFGTAVAVGWIGFVAGALVWPIRSPCAPPEPTTVERDMEVREPESQTPEQVDLAQLQACEDELAQARDLLALVATPFPKAGPETAEAWTKMLERVAQECPLAPYEVVLVDCSEYPCVAGLRPTAASGNWMPEPGPQRFAMRTALGSMLRTCSVLAEVFGPAFAEEAVVIEPQVAACPGADEALWSVFILDAQGAAFAYATQVDQTEREQAELERWTQARLAALATRWPCAERR